MDSDWCYITIKAFLLQNYAILWKVILFEKKLFHIKCHVDLLSWTRKKNDKNEKRPNIQIDIFYFEKIKLNFK